MRASDADMPTTTPIPWLVYAVHGGQAFNPADVDPMMVYVDEHPTPAFAAL